MIDAKNNLTLQSYIKYKNYKETKDMLDKKKDNKKSNSLSNGLLSRTRMVKPKTVNENSKFSELKKVDAYIDMIKEITNGGS
tara:strand:+ start:136 stop:381 length:246 start_codon:yes stop_codon:yes gene_type:complete